MIRQPNLSGCFFLDSAISALERFGLLVRQSSRLPNNIQAHCRRWARNRHTESIVCLRMLLDYIGQFVSKQTCNVSVWYGFVVQRQQWVMSEKSQREYNQHSHDEWNGPHRADLRSPSITNSYIAIAVQAGKIIAILQGIYLSRWFRNNDSFVADHNSGYKARGSVMIGSFCW